MSAKTLTSHLCCASSPMSKPASLSRTPPRCHPDSRHRRLQRPVRLRNRPKTRMNSRFRAGTRRSPFLPPESTPVESIASIQLRTGELVGDLATLTEVPYIIRQKCQFLPEGPFAAMVRLRETLPNTAASRPSGPRQWWPSASTRPQRPASPIRIKSTMRSKIPPRTTPCVRPRTFSQIPGRTW